jgi:hypothetical protein
MLRIIVLFLLSTAAANAVTLTQTVPEDIVFDLTPLTPTDAGDYFDDTHTRDLTYLTIDNIPNNITWTLFAKISGDIPGITVSIRREDNGTGAILPQGGTSYEKLTTVYTAIFTGEGKRFDIPVRTQLKSVGVSDDNGTFSTNIDYKIETE